MADVSSVGASNSFSVNQRNAENSLREVASGSRLSGSTRAAAEVAIATVLSGDDVVLSQASINVSQGISVAQVADGGLRQIEGGLVRLRELAALAGNGSLEDASRRAIDREFQEILDEVEGVAGNTRFNGQGLLDNDASLSFQVGSGAGETVFLDTVDATTTALGIDGLDLSSAADSATVLGAIDNALDFVAETRAELGANIVRFEFRAENLANQQEALVAARSALQNSDLGSAVTQSVAAGVQFEGQAFAVAQANRSAQQILSVLG